MDDDYNDIVATISFDEKKEEKGDAKKEQAASKSFQIQTPEKRRTGGKKSFCLI